MAVAPIRFFNRFTGSFAAERNLDKGPARFCPREPGRLPLGGLLLTINSVTERAGTGLSLAAGESWG
jgi:hypothetical protein